MNLFPRTSQEVLSIAEVPELFVDALATGRNGELWFLSVWGRDTAVQEFRARLSLPPQEGGLSEFRVGGAHGYMPVDVGNAERLQQLTGRMPQASLFGAIVHLWLYHRLTVEPDPVHRRAVLLCRPDSNQGANDRDPMPRQRVWNAVRQTCHLPLLPEWRDVILDACTERGWITNHSGFGIDAVVLDLGDAGLEDLITGLIREGRLTIPDQPRQA